MRTLSAGVCLCVLGFAGHAAMAQNVRNTGPQYGDADVEAGGGATSNGDMMAEDVLDDEMIIVTGTQSAGVAAVGRNALAKEEQARSIQIYDAGLVQDLKPEALEDLVTLSANVSFAGNTDGREVRFNVRGFDNAPILRDGFRVNSFGGVSNPELWNLERVEVLKGPDSIVYGEASPGGIINLRTKRPQQDNFLYLQTEFGTDPSASPRLDLNLAADSGLISGRVVALYEIDETFRDFDNPIETYSVSPSLRIDPAEGTIITFIGEATVEDGQADFGIVLDADGDLAVPRDFVINHPRDENRREFYMVGVDAEQRILDGLTAEGRVRYFESGYQYSSLFLPFTYDPSTRAVFRAPAVQGNDGDELAAQLNLFGEFELAGTRNRFTAGVDYRDSFAQTVTRFDPGGAIPLDLDNPDYSILPPPGDTLPPFPGVPQDQERVGVFLQYYFNPIDSLLINGGVRYDDVQLEDADTGETIRDFDNTSLQAGIRYEFSPAISIFGSYSESFTPSTALDLFSEPLPPQIGEGYEVGIKGQLFDSRLAYAVSYFDITNENIPRAPLVIPPDALNPLGSVPAGEERVEGIDLDISGTITDAWSVIFSIGYLDGEGADDVNLPNVADFTSALFTRYDVTENWGVSIGYEFVGERLGIADIDGDPATFDPLTVDPHFIGNAAIYYQRGRFNAQLNVSNIFDERYVDSVGNLARENYPGAPTEALLTLGVEF